MTASLVMSQNMGLYKVAWLPQSIQGAFPAHLRATVGVSTASAARSSWERGKAGTAVLAEIPTGWASLQGKSWNNNGYSHQQPTK